MKHIGVLGGTRFIGRHVVSALADAGHEVTTFTRGLTGRADPVPEGVSRVFGDRNEPGKVDAFLRRGFDAVFDLTAYTAAHVAPVLACRRAIGHYVLCSTSMVYRQPVAGPCNEDAPRQFSVGTYGGDKALAEEALLEPSAREGWPVTILRPNGVFGPLDAAQAGMVFARLAGSKPIVLNVRCRRRLNPVYVGDLARAFVRLADSSAARPRAYNVAGPEVVDQRDLVSRCSAILGVRADVRPLEHWPYPNIEVGLPWPEHDLVLATDRITHELGLTFTSFDAALAQTLDWLEETPGRMEASVPRAERLVGPGGNLPMWARLMLWTDDATSGWRARQTAASAFRWSGSSPI